MPFSVRSVLMSKNVKKKKEDNFFFTISEENK